MIRPCVAPIKPKILKDSDLMDQQPFISLPDNHMKIGCISSPKTCKQQYHFQNNSNPYSARLEGQRTGRIFRTQQKNQKQKDKSILKIKEHLEQLVQTISRDSRENKNDIRLMRKDISDLKEVVFDLNQKYKNCNEDSLKRTISNIVNNLTEGKKLVSLKQGVKIQGKFSTLQQKIADNYKSYLQGMQKAYTQVKSITVCLETLNNRLQNIQHNKLNRLSNIQQRVQLVQSGKSDSALKSNSSKKLSLSKIHLSQPKSIISNYQASQIKQTASMIERQDSSIINRLDSIQGSKSQMIMVSQEGDVTDIKGWPLIDSSGNIVVINIKQIRKMLQNHEN